ncbi:MULTISPECIES: hypothetical protein [unclassified Nocardioides]|uniref:hypothetical protein n=1 Tax=unclassified Nocardioides TaxID=2615069 RepID=UPI0006FDDD8F|nr:MULTISPECIES: hypothetical protein [unclassified Nocardioides]KQY56289.1 hypothetical protein ASD30_08000 [Nocardioides sp. Root140]KQZ75073.1 hypothetical protein ASD66_01465 [Nocardioides sp. Root151]KRF14148.1 hypothetical protein ASH02_07240 [Nocardioides sp. Soil796]
MITRGRIAAGVAVIAVVAGVAIAVERGFGPLPDPESCTAKVAGHEVELDLEQAENASLISAIATRRGLPARAVSIALATAYQESKIINLEYGDRDSLGLFQQRPSQGWGTREQLLDPYYATNAFYDALVKIDGYETMRITEAAQRVQNSGYPEAYEDHAEDAKTLASALTGNSQEGKFSCVVQGRPESEDDDLDETGLTHRAAVVRADLEAAFGDQALGGFAPEGVDSGHMEGSAHYEGRAIDVFVRPINEANRKQGWAMAYYLVAQADRLDIEHVIFDDMIWSFGSRSESGWRDYDPGDVKGKPAGTIAVLEHRDHVHVDVHD